MNQWDRKENLEISSHVYGQMTRAPRTFNGERAFFLINSAEKTGYPCREELSWTLM